MVERLGGLLDDARRHGFVGRSTELTAFDDALAGVGVRRILFLHGPGGIGKTTLVRRLRQRALDDGRAVIHIDGRESDVDTDTFHRATVGAGDAAVVVLVDGYERIAGLDTWIRDTWIPILPADAVVVIAGRDPPATPWRADPGWRALVGVFGIGLLTDDEAATLLQRAGVAPERIEGLVRLGAGHPLVLSLLAAASDHGPIPDALGDVPEVVNTVVPILTAESPDPHHELGLQLCAHVWLLTEALLRDAVGDAAADVWTWLARQPFISQGPDGLYAHDLVRDVLEAHLARRDPDARRRLHELVRRHARAQLADPHRAPAGTDRLRAATQLVWLHRHAIPTGHLYAQVLEDGAISFTVGRPSDHAEVLRHVGRWEGDDEAATVSRWLTARPEGLYLARRGPAISGFCHVVSWSDRSDPGADHEVDGRIDDPVTARIRAEIDRLGPLRPGEIVSLARSGGGPNHYRDPDVVVVCGVAVVVEWLTRQFAWAWCVLGDAELWEPTFDYMGFEHRLVLDDGRVARGIDWRRVGFDRWYGEAARRALTGETGPLDPSLLRPPLLDREQFGRAVRDALRCLGHPAELRDNPLMTTSLADTPAGADASRLHSVMRWAIAQLGDDPRAADLHRVLDRTFLRGTPTQEAAAEVLGLPFSTYRRWLARATERLGDLLWSVEVGERVVEDVVVEPTA